MTLADGANNGGDSPRDAEVALHRRVGESMLAIRTILIIDDDAALRRSLAEQLELHAEFASRQCDSGGAALRLLQEHEFDGVLLGDPLSDIDGHELCRCLRRSGLRAPIVILATADGPAERDRALTAGASDYVTKPLRVSDLLARLRAQLRQAEGGDDAVVTIGPYAFQPSARLLRDSCGRNQVRLTDKEAAILKFLYRAGTAIDRETLLGEVWGYNAGVTTHTLETHVYRLRRKIERDPANAEILVTEPGGYRLLP
jgi:DNA-binding response OmpR family regulator